MKRESSARISIASTGLALLVSLALPGEAASQDPIAEPEVEPPPTWRFKKADRPIKVMVLAGSIGAWPKKPYAEHIQTMCSKVEVKNLSKVGEGAWALRKRFASQVVENGYVNLKDPSFDYWLVFQGGLNSVGTPEKTNKDIRQLFLDAHKRGVEVVGLSLTPWGEESDKRRWAGIAGLEYKRHTQIVVDYVVGRLTPQQALGTYRSSRSDPDGPWDPAELADVGIDLYDSDLRDRNAGLRDVAKLRAALAKDKGWMADHAGLDEAALAQALDDAAALAAEIPRWYLRPELHSFDHIHPNEQGHALIAEIICPQLPASWGCSCPNAAPPEPAPAPEGSAAALGAKAGAELALAARAD
ncbi:hypothetical protein ACNOYE_08065 [Nannocystaceae bacterium ST9]